MYKEFSDKGLLELKRDDEDCVCIVQKAFDPITGEALEALEHNLSLAQLQIEADALKIQLAATEALITELTAVAVLTKKVKEI